MTKLFWIVLALAVMVAILGSSFASSPPTDTVDLQVLEQFYHLSYVIGALCGLLIALPVGLRSISAVRHREDEGASDFDDRVARRGVMTGVSAALVAIIVTLLAAAVYPMEQSATDQSLLVLKSLLVLVSPAIAMATAMVVYALATRMRRWGGTFSLTRR